MQLRWADDATEQSKASTQKRSYEDPAMMIKYMIMIKEMYAKHNKMFIKAIYIR